MLKTLRKTLLLSSIVAGVMVITVVAASAAVGRGMAENKAISHFGQCLAGHPTTGTNAVSAALNCTNSSLLMSTPTPADSMTTAAPTTSAVTGYTVLQANGSANYPNRQCLTDPIPTNVASIADCSASPMPGQQWQVDYSLTMNLGVATALEVRTPDPTTQDQVCLTANPTSGSATPLKVLTCSSGDLQSFIARKQSAGGISGWTFESAFWRGYYLTSSVFANSEVYLTSTSSPIRGQFWTLNAVAP